MSTASPEHRLHDLLDRALALPAAQRRGFVVERCVNEPDLRERLLRLLALAEDDSGFLDRSPLMLETAAAESAPTADPLDGHTIGAYRLVRKLGSGGMGEVWLGERIEGGFKQQVAIKRMHVSAGAALARFDAERDILAGLEHPRIARLYDGGVSTDGRPYMVMEYVEGSDLLNYCQTHQAPLEQRLDLFLQVCDAVAYAHAHLVVHRDLKPANILVNTEGWVKLLDFGIAKLVQAGELGDATRTLHLSPAYASPEQLTGGRVGTAADVYALGVTLYQLLTGHLPWQVSDLPLGAAVQRLLATQPPPASQRAGEHGPVPGRALRGDLDAIVAKALRKEPDQRYPDARALADDIRRHRRHEPVQARQGVRSYVARRFLRRNWLPLTTAAAVFMALVAGLVGIAWQARRAEQQAQRATSVQAFMSSLFASAGPSGRHGADASARDVLTSGIERLQQDRQIEPQVRSELLIIIGESFNALSLVHDAKTAFDLAAEQQTLYPATFADRARLRMRLAINAQDRGETALAAQQADSLLAQIQANGLRDSTALNVHALRANLLHLKLQNEDAYAALQPALQLIAQHPSEFDATDRADVSMLAGFILTDLGRFAEAQQASEQALAQYRQIEPNHPTIGKTLTLLALIHQDQGDYRQAEGYFRDGIAEMRRVLGVDSRDLIIGRQNFAGLLLRMGDAEGAQEQLRESQRIAEALAIDHPVGEARRRNLFGQALLETGDTAQAQAQLTLAMELARRGNDEVVSVRAPFVLAFLDCRNNPSTGLARLREQLASLDAGSSSWRVRGRLYYASCLEAAGERALAHAQYAAVAELLQAEAVTAQDHAHSEVRAGLERTRPG